MKRRVNSLHKALLSVSLLFIATIALSQGQEYCGPGTIWNSQQGICVIAFPGDLNFDDCVGTGDLLELLTAFGSCFVQDGPCNGVSELYYGNEFYSLVEIGNRCWIAENLRITSYQNGDEILNNTSSCGWGSLVVGAYRAYSNLESNASIQGYLYNAHALVDSRGLCPTGYSIPTKADFEQAAINLGGTQIAGGKMKSVENWGWPNYMASNVSGFSAYGSGFQLSTCNTPSQGLGQHARFWTSSSFSTNLNWSASLSTFSQELSFTPYLITDGMSVRCIKDADIYGCTDSDYQEYAPGANIDDGSCSTLIIAGCMDQSADNFNPEANVEDGSCEGIGACAGLSSVTFDGHLYEVVEIGDQCWFAENLQSDNYANGEPIAHNTASCGWHSTTSGAYRAYGNNLANQPDYGFLYNWYALTDERGICPSGWHAPLLSEAEGLVATAGGMSVAGGALKSLDFWQAPNTGATDEFDFSFRPGGYQPASCNASSIELGISGWLWTTSIFDEQNGVGEAVKLSTSSQSAEISALIFQTGLSVRCLKN